MMGLFQHHILYLHQADLGAALVFIQLHGDVPDLFPGIGDHHMLQRIHPTAGLFDFIRHQLTAFFHLRQAQKVGQKVGQAFHCVIQIGAGKSKAVGIDVGRVSEYVWRAYSIDPCISCVALLFRTGCADCYGYIRSLSLIHIFPSCYRKGNSWKRHLH